MRMKSRLIWLLPFMLPVSSANAVYLYNVGPNTVNMAGSACRTATLAGDAFITHLSGGTSVKSGAPLQRFFCPIPRRGTSFYQGLRGSGELPPPAGSALRVNISSVTVSGSDLSQSTSVSCFVFGVRMSDQAQYFGSTRYLCSTTGGCASPANSWTGRSSLTMNAHPSLKDHDTVNFGISCDVPARATIHYTESKITPN
jgi:hypothetical protein